MKARCPGDHPGQFPSDTSVPYGKAFTKEISLWVPRDIQPRDIRAVLDLLGRGKLSLASSKMLVSGRIQPR
jgi:hypothetical protein